MKRALLIGATGILAILLCLFLIDLELLQTLFTSIRWAYLVAGIAFLLGGYVFFTTRLRYIFLNEPRWSDIFFANSIGFAMNSALFMPAMAVRIVSIGWNTPVPIARASSGLLIERLLEQVLRVSSTVLAIALLASKEADPSASVGLSVLIVIVLLAAIVWAVHHRQQVVEGLVPHLSRFQFVNEAQVRSSLQSMMDGLDAVSSTRNLATSFLLSYISWVSFLAFQVLILTALAPDLSPPQTLLIAMAVMAVMPPSINLIPVLYHVVVVFVLVTFKLTDGPTAVAYAIVLHFIQMICWVLLGGWGLKRNNLSPQQVIQQARAYSKTVTSQASTSNTG